MKIIACSITLWLLVICAFGQEGTEEGLDPQRFSDELLGYQDNAGEEDQYENLLQTLSSPYDLNKVSAEELSLLHILTDHQIETFLAYRSEQEMILDVYELQVIPEFDLTVISRLLPFVTVRDPLRKVNRKLLQRIFSGGHSYVVSRYERTLETKKGFKKTADSAAAFTGSPDKLYLRFRSSQPGDFSVGLTGEKDAGEKITFHPRSNPLGFDFTSFHLQLQHKGKLQNLIVGDFQAQFAQGLILGGAFGLGKGGESISTTRKSNVGFLPYTTINESAYQRGVAFTWKAFGPICISGFFSRAKRDASSNGSDTVSTFQTTGYHRTASELANRKKVTERNYGVVIQFQKKHLDAGLILNALHFDLAVNKSPTLYNQNAFGGTENLNTGIFLNYRIQNISLFGETAGSIQGGRAAIAGLLLSAHRNLDLAMVYRNYMRNFYTFYSNAFSENTSPQNERGVYWGWKYRLNRQYNLAGYVDLFTFPWLGFRRYAPSNGFEWMLRGNYQPSKKVSVSVQLREESKSRNLPDVTNLYRLGKGIKRNVAVNCSYGTGGKLTLKSRVQYSHYFFNDKATEGFGLVQDISFSRGSLKFTARHALFDTDHYDNRQYVYENDAWLTYSLPAYSGVGVRNYVLIEYKVHKQLTIWVRYARTLLLKGQEIGSGEEVIEGNTRNDVKFQVRFKF